jgi:uncharacterized protein (DUF305 family)
MFKKIAMVAVIAALSAAYANAQTQSGSGTMGGMMQSEMMMKMKPGMQMSEADKGYMAAMQAMGQRMMEMEMTGDPSGDFARMMIPHHQSAVDMAEVLLAQKEIDPEMKKLAEKVVEDQTKEIEQLKAWLQAHQNR